MARSKRLILSGRDARFPNIRLISAHPQVKGKHGPIYVVEGTTDPVQCERQLESISRMTLPGTPGEARDQGWLILDPEEDPRLIWRDKEGKASDVLKLWFSSSADYTEDERTKIVAVAEDIVGPDGPNSEGFTAYELNEKCASSGKGGRSYSLATTHQDFRDMEAPFKGRKTYGRPLDKHDQVTKDLLEALATCSMRCFNKAPQSLKTPIQRRSAMLNLPRIGADENYAFPAFHLNISSTKEPTSAHGNLSNQIGSAGALHFDTKDTPGGISCVTNLSQDRADVTEVMFLIPELGVGFTLRFLDSGCFSGLGGHRGSELVFKTHGAHTRPHVRIMGIGYPPAHHFDGTASSALATIPSNGKTVDDIEGKHSGNSKLQHKGSNVHVQTEVLKLFKEAKQWKIPDFPLHREEAQATYLSDSKGILQQKSYAEHACRSITTLVAYLVAQVDPVIQLRFDRDKLLSAFSWVDSERRTISDPYGVRTEVGGWPEGPGWAGDDVKIGKKYREDFRTMDVKQQTARRNTDAASDDPYGNSFAAESVRLWDEHVALMAKSLPLCVISGTVVSGKGAIRARQNAANKITRATEAGSQTENDARDDGNVPTTSAEADRPARVTRQSKRKAENEETGARGGEKVQRINGANDVSTARKGRDAAVRARNQKSLKGKGLIATLSKEALAGESDALKARRTAVRAAEGTKTVRGKTWSEDLPSKVADLLDGRNLQEVWKIQGSLTKHEAITSIELVQERSRVMILNMIAWEWLDRVVEEGYNEYIQGKDHWLSRLLDTAKCIVLTPDISRDLQASRFVDGLDNDPVYHYKPRPRRRYQNGEKAPVLALVKKILRVWYSYPDNDYWQLASVFTRKMVDILGPHSLFYPPVYDAYCNIRKAIDSSSQLTKNVIAKWAEKELAKEAVAVEGSEEEKLFKHVCVGYSGGGQKIFELMDTLEHGDGC